MPTIGSKLYKLFDNAGPKVVYSGPANTVSQKDLVALVRQAPTPSKDSAGSQGGILRVQRGTVVGTVNKTITISANSTVPVGSNQADVDEAIAVFRDWVAHATFADLVNAGIVNV